MWPFKRKAPFESPGLIAARQAEARASEEISTVQSRSDEVEYYASVLQERGQKNNFGEALRLAMETRHV